MLFSEWDEYAFFSQSYKLLYISFKQNEENKKKNKLAALKAQMDLEEARKAASPSAEHQKNNNASPDQEGGTWNEADDF